MNAFELPMSALLLGLCGSCAAGGPGLHHASTASIAPAAERPRWTDSGDRIVLAPEATGTDLFAALRARGARSGSDSCYLIFGDGAYSLPMVEIVAGATSTIAGWTCDAGDLEPLTRSRGKIIDQYILAGDDVTRIEEFTTVGEILTFAPRGGVVTNAYDSLTGAGGPAALTLKEWGAKDWPGKDRTAILIVPVRRSGSEPADAEKPQSATAECHGGSLDFPWNCAQRGITVT